MCRQFFPFIRFLDPLYIFAKMYRSRGGTSHHPSETIFMFLESVEHREWEYLQS